MKTIRRLATITTIAAALLALLAVPAGAGPFQMDPNPGGGGNSGTCYTCVNSGYIGCTQSPNTLGATRYCETERVCFLFVCWWECHDSGRCNL